MNALTPAGLFSLSSELMTPLWLLLILSLFFVRLERGVRWIACIGVPVLLGAVYAAALLPHVPFASGGFGSLAELRALFSSDWLLLAGWVHYLAFDFFVGAWIARHSAGLFRGLVIACLILCFLAGPLGLLSFLLLRGTSTAVAKVRG